MGGLTHVRLNQADEWITRRIVLRAGFRVAGYMILRILYLADKLLAVIFEHVGVDGARLIGELLHRFLIFVLQLIEGAVKDVGDVLVLAAEEMKQGKSPPMGRNQLNPDRLRGVKVLAEWTGGAREPAFNWNGKQPEWIQVACTPITIHARPAGCALAYADRLAYASLVEASFPGRVNLKL
jgi:hypothetical protein